MTPETVIGLLCGTGVVCGIVLGWLFGTYASHLKGYDEGYKNGYRDGILASNPGRVQYNYPDKEEGDKS